MTEIERCSVCRCFKALDNSQGECKRYPPDHTGKSPIIFKDNWCCEFLPKTLNEVVNEWIR